MSRKEKADEIREGFYLLPKFDRFIMLWYLRWREWLVSYMNAHWINPPASLLVMLLYFIRHKR